MQKFKSVILLEGGIQRGGGAPAPPKIGKNMIFCVKSWFSIQNTPIFFSAPPPP
jgi:hypothetical protein